MRVDFLLDYDVITVERDHKLYLMARLLGSGIPQQTDRRPLNLSLVLDRSGSMAGNKIEYTRQAAHLLVQNMNTDDTLSIVLYNESVETLLPPQHVQHKDMINQRISQIKAGGTTNLSGGWLEGVEHVMNNLETGTLNRVILMTDGLANRGITAQDRLVEIAGQKFFDGVSTTTMGLGEDFNEDLLIAMADAGGGAFYFIESPEVTPGIFQEELQGLLSVIGQNLVVTFEPTDYVADMRQLNAFPEEKRHNGTAFRMGDVFGEEIKTLMLEIGIPALKDVGEVQIATLHFEYDELTDGRSERRKMEVPVKVNVAPLALGDGEENAEVTRSRILLQAAEARREAIRLADKGRYNEAAKLLRDAAEAIRLSPVKDDILEEERVALISQAKDMDRGTEFYQSYNRKSMSTQAYFTGRGTHENTQAFRMRESKRKQDDDNPEVGVTDFENNRQTGLFDFPNVENNPNQSPQLAPEPAARPSGETPTKLQWGEKTYLLDKDLIRIGRAPQNEVVINTNGMSRFHAQIRREGDDWILEDLASTNGTHVDGRMIDKPHILRSGDVVFFCDQRVTFEV